MKRKREEAALAAAQAQVKKAKLSEEEEEDAPDTPDQVVTRHILSARPRDNSLPCQDPEAPAITSLSSPGPGGVNKPSSKPRAAKAKQNNSVKTPKNQTKTPSASAKVAFDIPRFTEIFP